MATTPLRPDTATGTKLFAVDPLPSWPERLFPQQRTELSVRLTQV
jgi:hypothetical protein